MPGVFFYYPALSPVPFPEIPGIVEIFLIN